ncbi:unnamed protein product [Effrenium voratum]|nr:unnamed protein product [Effrenium voratum]
MRRGGKAARLAGPQHTAEDSAAPLGAGRGRAARKAFGSEDISSRRGAIRTEHESQKEDSHPRRRLQQRRLRGDAESGFLAIKPLCLQRPPHAAFWFLPALQEGYPEVAAAGRASVDG